MSAFFYIDEIDRALIQHAAASMQQSLECLADELAEDGPHCGTDCDDACQAKHRADNANDITALIALQTVVERAYPVEDSGPVDLACPTYHCFALDLQTDPIARVLIDALDMLDLEDSELWIWGIEDRLTPDEVKQRNAALYSATMKAWPGGRS